MTDTESHKKGDKFAKPRQRKPRATEIDECRAWLAGLGFQSAPNVHVNGISHPTAVMVVDFGTPLHETVKLSPEQAADLITYMNTNTRILFRDREVKVRVQSDTSTGIWWTSVA